MSLVIKKMSSVEQIKSEFAKIKQAISKDIMLEPAYINTMLHIATSMLLKEFGKVDDNMLRSVLDDEELSNNYDNNYNVNPLYATSAAYAVIVRNQLDQYAEKHNDFVDAVAENKRLIAENEQLKAEMNRITPLINVVKSMFPTQEQSKVVEQPKTNDSKKKKTCVVKQKDETSKETSKPSFADIAKKQVDNDDSSDDGIIVIMEKQYEHVTYSQPEHDPKHDDNIREVTQYLNPRENDMAPSIIAMMYGEDVYYQIYDETGICPGIIEFVNNGVPLTTKQYRYGLIEVTIHGVSYYVIRDLFLKSSEFEKKDKTFVARYALSVKNGKCLVHQCITGYKTTEHSADFKYGIPTDIYIDTKTYVTRGSILDIYKKANRIQSDVVERLIRQDPYNAYKYSSMEKFIKYVKSH